MSDTRRIADMTPAERDVAIRKAVARLQAELTRNAPEIARLIKESDEQV